MNLDTESLQCWPLPGASAGDEHARGTVLVIGGTGPTVGAVLLAGIAALKIGAGRLQLAVGASVAPSLAVAVPEAMVIGLSERSDGTIRPRRAAERLAPMLNAADAVLLGPGLIGARPTRRLLHHAAAFIGPATSVVLDAQALIAAAHLDPHLMRSWCGRLALTPNRDELEQLLQARNTHSTADVATDVAAAASLYGATVTSYSEIATCDGRQWSSPQGGPTLATSGSGDVLAGLLAGAVARSGDTAQAACWATYVHTLAAHHARQETGQLSVLARDLLSAIPVVLHELDR